MAKRIIDWTEVGSMLVMSKVVGGDLPNEKLKSFDLVKIYPKFNEMTDVQKHLIVYGTKQKLADCGSAEKDPQEKAKLAKAKFQDFVDGKLVGARTNGTGAKANKAVVDGFKKMAEVASLEGLMTRKILAQNDPTIVWSESDQEKLNEFMAIAAEHAKKQQGKKN